MNVQTFLKDRHVPFEAMNHPATYNAQHLAESVHAPGDEVAKSVLLKADDAFVLAVLPATHAIDLGKASEAIKAGHVTLASEAECGSRFPDCELGALPPFGSQYGMPTLVDESLLEDEQIYFEGNNHREAIRMRLDDFRALEQPIVAPFSHHI